MTTPTHPESNITMHVMRLNPSHGPVIAACIDSDPFTYISMKGLNTYTNLALLPWYGLFSEQILHAAAVLLPNQMALVATRNPIDCAPLGLALKGHHGPVMVIGRPADAHGLWRWSSQSANETRQTLYTANQVENQQPVDGFRKATIEDLDVIRSYSIAGALEETG